MSWTDYLTERERQEVHLANIYTEEFCHGTDGHHRLLLIAKLAGIIDRIESKLLESKFANPNEETVS